MLGVNGKPFISLDAVLDTSMMAEIHDEICFGLATISQTNHSITSCIARGDAALDLHDFRFKESAELSEADTILVKTMTQEQRRRFIMIKYGVYLPWSYCVNLLDNANIWTKKHKSEGKTINDEVRRLFPKTLEFCYGLPLFSEIGRISIFGVYPSHHVVCHRDTSPAVWNLDDELVMVSPTKAKPLFIYDADTKEKHYIDSHIAVFNDMDYHGADACTFFTYNFRIDGIYTPEWKEKIKFGR